MSAYRTRGKVSEFLTKNQSIKKIYNNDRDAIVVTDKKSTVEFINPEFTRLFGYTSREAIGKSVNDLIVHETSHVDLRKSRTAYQDERKNIKSIKSGRKISVFNRLIPIMEGNETIGGFAYYRGADK